VKINFKSWLDEKAEASDFKSHYTFEQFYLYEFEVKEHLKWVCANLQEARIKIPFEFWLHN
jgi:hypothetical protein